MPITLSISKEGIEVAVLYIIFYNLRSCKKNYQIRKVFWLYKVLWSNLIVLLWSRSPIQLWICFMWYLCTNSIKLKFLQNLAHFHSSLHQMIWANTAILMSPQRFWILVEWCQWLFPGAYKSTGRTIAYLLSSKDMKIWVWKWVWQCQPILWW